MNRLQHIGATAIVLATLAIATPVLAHIDPDPTDAQAGSEVSVGFTVQHGCDGSPTVQLDMRLPDGVTSATAEPPAGWTGSVDVNIVTFEGGPLPDDQELTFRVRLTLPPTPDITIYFPFVQRCATGEIRWIDIPSDGGGQELDEPAPAMRLFGPAATTQAVPITTTAPTAPAPATSATTVGPTATTLASPTTTSPVPATPPATVPPSTTPPSTTPPDTSTAATTDSGDGGRGSSGTVVFALSIAAVMTVAGIVISQSRRRRR